jgi:hypothetical protein
LDKGVEGPNLLIYWALFLVLAGGALLNADSGFRRSRPAFLMLAALPTILMIGLRWKIGPDWVSYKAIFESSHLYSFSQTITRPDAGFYTLNWALDQLNAPFWILNFVCGVVFTVGLTAFCSRQPNPWLAFLVAFPYLVIVIAMSALRQSVALGFLFLALNAYEDGRLNRFLVLGVIAAAFHGSALLMIPLCLLSYSKSNLQRVVLLIIALGLSYYFFQDVFSHYARRYSTERMQSGGTAYRLAMNSLAAVIFLAAGRRFALPPHISALWRNVSLCTLAFGLALALAPSSTALDRLLLYFFPLQFFVLSRIPQFVRQERLVAGQATLLVVAYAALIQIVFLSFGTFATSYVPYRTILGV